MITHGAENTYTKRGATLITKLINADKLALVECLLKNGCTICAEPVTKRTELHVFKSNYTIRHLLIRHTSKELLELKDRWGNKC